MPKALDFDTIPSVGRNYPLAHAINLVAAPDARLEIAYLDGDGNWRTRFLVNGINHVFSTSILGYRENPDHDWDYNKLPGTVEVTVGRYKEI